MHLSYSYLSRSLCICLLAINNSLRACESLCTLELVLFSLFIYIFFLFSLFIFRVVSHRILCAASCFCAPKTGALTRFAQLHFMGIPFWWHAGTFSALLPISLSPLFLSLSGCYVCSGIFYAYFAGRTRQDWAEKTLCKFLIKANVSKRHAREEYEMGNGRETRGRTDGQFRTA